MVTPTPNANGSDNILRGASRIPGSTGAWGVGFHLNTAAPYQTLVERFG